MKAPLNPELPYNAGEDDGFTPFAAFLKRVLMNLDPARGQFRAHRSETTTYGD